MTIHQELIERFRERIFAQTKPGWGFVAAESKEQLMLADLRRREALFELAISEAISLVLGRVKEVMPRTKPTRAGDIRDIMEGGFLGKLTDEEVAQVRAENYEYNRGVSDWAKALSSLETNSETV